MKKTILLTNRYDGIVLDMLNKAIDDRFILLMPEDVTKQELVKAAEYGDYFLSSGRLKIDEDVLRNSKKLKMIQRTGVGIDTIDLPLLKKYHIPLYVNRGVNSSSVAEYAVMLILSLLKKRYDITPQMKEGKWDKQKNGIQTHELAEKTVGIIGMGNIGRKVAMMLNGFGCRIIYYDQRRLSEKEENDLHITFTEPELLYRISDIITLHCAYDPSGTYLIKEEELALMKNGVFLVNTARGKLISEKALIAALNNGKVAACALDTFEQEPLPAEHEFRKMNNVILSPHIAGLSYESYQRMFDKAIDNIILFDEGKAEEILDCRVV